MPRISLWTGKKGFDYKFTDRVISEFMGASGTGINVYKYLGVHDQRANNPDGTPPTDAEVSALTVQDVLFLENHDYKYDTTVYELRGTYNVQDYDFDLRQFGLFLTGDTHFFEFHLNDMIAMIGRKLMAGDVIELPHQRDDALLDENSPAVNKYYVITDAQRASNGYAASWFPHIWRVKGEPMTNSQQYKDILDKQAENPYGIDQGKLGDIIGTVGKELELNEAVIELAKADVKARNFETQQFYVIPGDETGSQNPWIFAGDGIPPNGAALVGSGKIWPKNPANGTYFLRTDMQPHTLYRYDSGKWRMQEQDYRRGHWSVAHRLLEDFINNNTITNFKDGTSAPEKQPLFKAVKPRADF